MFQKLFNWLHSDMEFRVREERMNNDTCYYPQVKGGILGKMGMWRYFTPLYYKVSRYTVWSKTELMRCVPVKEWSRKSAEEDIESFIKTLIPFNSEKHEKKRITYKYRTVGSDGTVRYI